MIELIENNKESPSNEGQSGLWNCDRMNSLVSAICRQKAVGSTGLRRFDSLLGGGLLQGVYILAGEPGAGKSSFALQIADYIAAFGKRKVLYVSLEMSAAQLVAKSFARLSSQEKSQPLSFREIGNLLQAYHNAEPKRIEFLHSVINRYTAEIAPNISTQDSVVTLSDIRKLYDSLSGEFLPPILILDYLQLVGLEPGVVSANDTQRLSNVMRGLCDLSKHYQIPIIALSSQNRSKRGKSSLDSLDGAGQIEYGATGVWFLSVDGNSDEERQRNSQGNPRPVHIDIAKNRFGTLGSLPLMFDPSCSKFIERD